MKPFRTTAICLAVLFSCAAWARPSHHDGPPPSPQEMMEQVREMYPDKYAYLMELKQSNPQKFRMAMQRMRHHMGKMGKMDPEMKEHHQKMRAQHEAFREQAEAYQEASKKDQETLRVELTDMATDLFELKQEYRRLRVERAKEHIADLEDEIAERDAAQETLIEEFVEEAIGTELKGL